MITLAELLKHHTLEQLPKEHQDNIFVLLDRINQIRTAYAKPMLATNCYRTWDEHLEIYKSLAAKHNAFFDIAKVPTKSKHLIGAAVDIYDKDGELMKWCRENEELLASVGLWCEDETIEPRVHFQILPPLSGARFFKP